jgi:hypothetical protein
MPENRRPQQVFGVDVNVRRNEISKNAPGRTTMASLEGGVTPSDRGYAWVTG